MIQVILNLHTMSMYILSVNVIYSLFTDKIHTVLLTYYGRKKIKRNHFGEKIRTTNHRNNFEALIGLKAATT